MHYHLVLPLKLYGYPRECDSVKIAKAEITQLRHRNAEILEELSQSKEQATVLNNEKVNLINLLEQQRELSSKLKITQEAEETLAGTQSELQHAKRDPAFTADSRDTEPATE